MADNRTLHSFISRDLRIDHVIVYADRAEVKRVVNIRLTGGRNEVLISELPSTLNADSIRVVGRGNAAILEIRRAEKQVSNKNQLEEEKVDKKAHDELKELENEKVLLNINSTRLSKSKELLDTVAMRAMRGCCECKPDEKERSFLPFPDCKGLDNLLQFYNVQMEKWDDSLDEMRRNVQKIDDKIRDIEGEVDKNDKFPVDAKSEKKTTAFKEITIFIDAVEDGESSLDIFYIVNNASWEPCYNLQVQSDQAMMQLTYQALIRQETGEDWQDAKLTLSTAAPFLAGQMPELGTTKISLHQKKPSVQICPRPAGLFGSAIQCGSMLSTREASYNFGLMPTEPSATLPEMRHNEATVVEDVTRSEFKIDTRNTIQSDKSSHKVTIAVISLTPKFEYYAIPSKSPNAYVKVNASNASPYILLAGPVSVTVNNGFVANSLIKRTACSEKLEFCLGADPAIKIDYPPAKTSSQQVGMVSKWMCETREQQIVVYNGRTDPIQITVLEPLPQSTDEKIKVSLVEPSSKEGENAEFSLNDSNNIEWRVSIAGHEKLELIVKYNIEYPIGERLEYSASH